MRTHSRPCSTLLILWMLWLGNAPACQAQITYHVSLDTAPLIGASDGPLLILGSSLTFRQGLGSRQRSVGSSRSAGEGVPKQPVP